MNNADFLIRFSSPRLGYGSVVLDNSELLEIPQGVSVVLGPNGAGKSTLGLVMEKDATPMATASNSPAPT